MIIIYKITNPNGKLYVGQTKNLTRRSSEYRRLKCKSQILLYNSIVKYGFNNHKVEVIEEVDDSCGDVREIYHISLSNSYFKNNKNGMNLTPGGSRPPNIEGKEHYRAKEAYQYTLKGKLVKKWDCIRDAKREFNYNSTAICASIKGSFSVYGYVWSYNPMKFDSYIPNKGGVPGKKIVQMSYDGTIINTFDSILQAEKSTGISRRAIRRHLGNEEIKRIRTPYKWSYSV